MQDLTLKISVTDDKTNWSGETLLNIQVLSEYIKAYVPTEAAVSLRGIGIGNQCRQVYVTVLNSNNGLSKGDRI